MTTGAEYAVVFERDGQGWLVDAPSLRGAHTHGRTIAIARARIREVIALVDDLDDEAAITLRESFRLPEAAGRAVALANEARGWARLASDSAQLALQAAAAELVAAGVSMRDAGDVLGISHGRAQQLASASEATGGGRAEQFVDWMTTVVPSMALVDGFDADDAQERALVALRKRGPTTARRRTR